ncbi:MAG: GtrA family protein [Pontixanthobacter sp.]
MAKADDSASGGLFGRLFSAKTGGMLLRNTIVSTGVFLVGLALLWVLVQKGGMDEVIAAGIGFVTANSLHYALGRSWIFRGTQRALAAGYALFLVNGGIGLLVTMVLYAAMLQWTSINYLVARIIVSVFAGLIVFVLNAVWNFRRV